MKEKKHPFELVKELIVNDTELEIDRLKSRVEILENQLKKNMIKSREARESSLSPPLSHEKGPSSNSIAEKSLIKKSLGYSAFFSFLFIAVFALTHLLLFTTPSSNKIENDKNPILLDDYSKSSIATFAHFLAAKEMPIIFEKNKIYINSFNLNDVYKIYSWSKKYDLSLSDLNFVLPVDFVDHFEENQIPAFSRYFPYQIDFNKNNSREFHLSIVGIDTALPYEHERLFNIIFDSAVSISYSSLRLPVLFFDINSHKLNEKNEEKLIPLITFMKDVSSPRLIITGHADRLGEEKINKDLSCKRARSVEAFFMKNHISATRLEVKCYSNLQANSKIQEKNRKVELEWENW